MKIDQLLRTLGVAIQEAHEAIEGHTVNQFLEHYFDRTVRRDGCIDQEKDDTVQEKGSIDGQEYKEVYTPKMIEVVIPSEGGNVPGKVLYTPVATLVQHRHLNLDNVKLNLNISVLEESEDNLQVAAQGGNTQNDGSREHDAGMLEITFKCSDTTEGIARIETQLNGML